MAISTAVQSLISVITAISLVFAPLVDCCARHICSEPAIESTSSAPHSNHGAHIDASGQSSHDAHASNSVFSESNVGEGEDQPAGNSCADYSCDLPIFQTKNEKPVKDTCWSSPRVIVSEASPAALAAGAKSTVVSQIIFTPPQVFKTPVYLLTQRVRI